MHAVYASHSERCWRARQGRDRCPAFTLIELLVVTAILALLVAILLPTLQRVRKQAKAAACQAELRPKVTAISVMLTCRP